jgi:outer membrane receptor protein involved in Fe transport
MRPKLIIITLLIFLAAGSYSQQAPSKGNGVISGTVYDHSTRQPMEYANIVIFKKSDSLMLTGTVTNEKGNFRINNIPAGNYYIVANFIGYNKTLKADISLSDKNNQIQFDSIFLSPLSYNVKEVNIVSDKAQVEYKIDKKVINVSQQLNATGGTALDVLQNTPSIKVDIDGNVTLRGNSNFTVLIDGRPSPFQGADALKQIPANTIDNIEIVTNPSAKYESEGSSGIINIITKKQKSTGFSGVVNASVGTGNKYNGDFTLNYKYKKVSLILGADARYNDFNQNVHILRTSDIADTNYFLENNSNRVYNRSNYSGRAGIDYFINDRNTLNFIANIGSSGFERRFESKNSLCKNPVVNDAYSISKDHFDFLAMYYIGNLSYTHKFGKEGSQIINEINYQYIDGTAASTTEQYNANGNFEISDDSPSKMISDNLNKKTELRYKLDFTYKFSDKFILDAGAQINIFDKKINVVYNYFDYPSNSWINNELFSNAIDFKQNIYAGYTTISGNLFTVDYQIGLRAEYTDRDFYQITMDKNYPFDKLNFFPTVAVSKSFKNDHQLQLSYSRRINRPWEFWLNPFPDYSDAYYLSYGNPNLEPEYTDSYELNYIKSFKKWSFNIDNYYRQNNNAIDRVLFMDSSRNVMLQTPVNMSREISYGSEIAASLDFLKWLKINPSVNLYYYRIDGSVNNVATDYGNFTWSAQLTATFIIGKNSRIQFNGMYNAKNITTQGNIKPLGMLGVTYRQDFFNKKLSATLNIQDILKTGKYQITSYGPNFEAIINANPEAPVISINLSYKINNFKRVARQQENIDMNIGGGI